MAPVRLIEENISKQFEILTSHKQALKIPTHWLMLTSVVSISVEREAACSLSRRLWSIKNEIESRKDGFVEIMTIH